ncbi:MAG: diguanylate cyclase [Sulfurimonas sp.]|nr:diguanylate cyclase [Sulfurimonas sp.]
MKFILLFFLALTLFAADEKVSLQLMWKHQFQFAGFYIAKEKGFYKDAGLDVEIKEYESSTDIVEEVLSQRATYGVGRSSLLIDRAHGKKIVLLSASFQTSPSVLISTDEDIHTPIDLRDKKVMMTPDEVNSVSILTMLLANGVHIEDLQLQRHSYDYHDLLNKNTDAMAAYISNEPYFLEQAGVKYTVFSPKEYGYDFVGDLLFTSEKELYEHPSRAKAFNDATNRGWIWAFEHIQESAQLIYEKYNTQNKPLDALIYEANALKKLAFVDDIPFGHICAQRYTDIANIYRLSGFLKDYNVSDLYAFVDPLKFNLKEVKIGVLAKRGDSIAHIRWDTLADFLNKELHTYNFKIIPIEFAAFEDTIKNERVDLIITNDMLYVLAEQKYGASRIATMFNKNSLSDEGVKEFGSVIFTRVQSASINTLEDLKHKKIAAVSQESFGGWIMAYETLLDNKIDTDTMQLSYYQTHDKVVDAVMSKEVEVGIVRTDMLEAMEATGTLKLADIKIIHPQEYKNFPYLLSTKLYPEWPLAKLAGTDDKIARNVLSVLLDIDMKKNPELLSCGNWSVAADYSSVHVLLKKLKIAPYDNPHISLEEILDEYIVYFYLIVFLFIAVFGRYIYINKINKYLQNYNEQLNYNVLLRTQELQDANKKLKRLAQTDALTGIANRGHFMEHAEKYFELAKRNKSSLQVLSLDLDLFKAVNDTYGHQAGDAVLVAFTQEIEHLLRKTDLFGRIGGEEFCIILQETPLEGAIVFAKRVCTAIEAMDILHQKEMIHVTVSIGIADLKDEKNISELINKSDKALYKAKENGRNQYYIEKEA